MIYTAHIKPESYFHRSCQAREYKVGFVHGVPFRWNEKQQRYDCNRALTTAEIHWLHDHPYVQMETFAVMPPGLAPAPSRPVKEQPCPS